MQKSAEVFILVCIYVNLSPPFGRLPRRETCGEGWCVREFLCVVMLEFVFHIVGSFCFILGQVILSTRVILH